MIELGLQRISRLLENTPLPWRAIHVAGTNGKGSICAYTSAMLAEYNKSRYREINAQPTLKHARFTSPHLIDRWDCLTINQQTVPFKLFDHIEKQVLRRNEQGGLKASEFELLTATAFEIFTHEEVDVGVVEVGMGGRLDATNIIGQPVDPSIHSEVDAAVFRPPPLVTAISKIGLDHQAFLGNTLEEIAREKAGILKSGVPVVWDTSNDARAIQVLETKAESLASRVVNLDSMRLPHHMMRSSTVKSLLLHDPPAYIKRGLPAMGRVSIHQRLNLSVAFRSTWTALQALERLPDLSDRIIHPGMYERANELSFFAYGMTRVAYSKTTFPGRLQRVSLREIVDRKEEILLDGAHNAQSAEVLRETVDRLRKSSEQAVISCDAASKSKAPKQHPRPRSRKGMPLLEQPLRAVSWVIAASESKDAKEILSPLLRAGDSVFVVEFGPVDGMPWVKPMAAHQLVQAVQDLGLNICVRSCGTDVLSALRSAGEEAAGGPMVVAGSLYLVGDVLRLLRDHEGRTS